MEKLISSGPLVPPAYNEPLINGLYDDKTPQNSDLTSLTTQFGRALSPDQNALLKTKLSIAALVPKLNYSSRIFIGLLFCFLQTMQKYGLLFRTRYDKTLQDYINIFQALLTSTSNRRVISDREVLTNLYHLKNFLNQLETSKRQSSEFLGATYLTMLEYCSTLTNYVLATLPRDQMFLNLVGVSIQEDVNASFSVSAAQPLLLKSFTISDVEKSPLVGRILFELWNILTFVSYERFFISKWLDLSGRDLSKNYLDVALKISESNAFYNKQAAALYAQYIQDMNILIAKKNSMGPDAFSKSNLPYTKLRLDAELTRINKVKKDLYKISTSWLDRAEQVLKAWGAELVDMNKQFGRNQFLKDSIINPIQLNVFQVENDYYLRYRLPLIRFFMRYFQKEEILT